MKLPAKVARCTTHHHACECREYRMQEMESALKIIATWATVHDHGCPEVEFEDIRGKAMDALNCLSNHEAKATK